MFSKNLKKIYTNYIKKIIASLIQFFDETLNALGEYFQSHVSREERERLLSLLIEDIQRYKDGLQEHSSSDSCSHNTTLLQ